MKMSESQIIATEIVSLTGKPKVICDFCNISFGKRGNLYRHLKKFHQLQVLAQCSQICGLCNEKFRTVAILQEHIQNEHAITLKFEDKTFYSEKDFRDWKNKIEDESKSSFVVRNSDKKKIGISQTFYICHRSGQYKPKPNRVRNVKASGTIKTGFTCPACMKVSTQTVDGISEIQVQYQSVHVGHDSNTRTPHLSKSERANLAACLKLGIPMDRILQQAKQNALPNNKYHLLTRKHLHNICRDFGLKAEKPPKAAIPQNNDAESSDDSMVYEDYQDIEVSNQEEKQDDKKMQEHEKSTAVSSLLLLQNHSSSEEFKNRKMRVINQLKELLLRAQEWNPAYPLPDIEEHIGALNALFDISASSHGISSQLQETQPVLSETSTNKRTVKQRKINKSKESVKKS